MGEFGETLRKERETRGISLTTITQVTKISNRHLVALEQEQFQSLPGGVFNKGIVREYARVVGLNEDEWVNRYLSAYRESGSAPQEEFAWERFAENTSLSRKTPEGRRPEMRLRWTGVIVLLILLAGLSWFVFNYVNQKAEPAGAGPVTSQRISTPLSALILS